MSAPILPSETHLYSGNQMAPTNDSSLVISVKNLTKIFSIYQRPLDMVLESISHKNFHSEFIALHDVSFEAHRGEILGFIGRNGAGKSTLLKILTGTLDKTSGNVAINGRISAILELGTGFHQHLTGRENIRMGGLCMGMSVSEIEEKMESIIEFSELREFIDQPFRTYSSGMQARLTFATVAAVNADILIIDESMSVGDAKFQLKCFDRIRQMKNSGATILLVSHDINSIASLCDRVALLDHGIILDIGLPKDITRQYYQKLFGVENHPVAIQNPSAPNQTTSSTLERSPNTRQSSYDSSSLFKKKAVISELAILSQSDDKPLHHLMTGKPYVLRCRINFHESIDNPTFGILIRNNRGVEIFATNSTLLKMPPITANARDSFEYRVELCFFLNHGPYFLTAAISEKSTLDGWQHWDSKYDNYRFEMNKNTMLTDASLVDLLPKMHVRKLPPHSEDCACITKNEDVHESD